MKEEVQEGIGILIIVCMLLSSCNASGNSKSEEKAEYSYLIEKLNLFTGEGAEREIDLGEKCNIADYSVDEEENVYYLITVEGKQIYQKSYSYETLEDLGLPFRIKLRGDEVSISGQQKQIMIDDKGDVLSIEQAAEQEKRELEAFQGAVYRGNESGPSDKLFDLINYGIE